MSVFPLQWEIVQTVINGSQLYTYSICNVANDGDQDNWLRTTYIQRRPDVSRVSVELQFVVRDCGTFDGNLPSCRETFGLYLAESDVDVGTSFRKANFRKVATVAPDEVTADRAGGKAALRVNVETKTVGPLSRRGFYLAFQDSGACVALTSVRVFYTICPATVQGQAAFPEKVAGTGALAEVEGTCVENAVMADQAPSPRMYCTSEGDWVVPVGECQCRAGYQAVGDSCKGKINCAQTESHFSFIFFTPYSLTNYFLITKNKQKVSRRWSGSCLGIQFFCVKLGT